MRRCCSDCNRSAEELRAARVPLDTYNDFDGEPGVLVCDDCIHAAADPGPTYAAYIERPEGYYHMPVGSFD